MGDALAVALLDARGFRADDFARSHPGGALGRKLLTLVSDVMRSGAELARVPQDADLMALMREISAKGLGMSAVVDGDDRVLGVFTDGDLRRLIEKSGSSVDLRSLRAQDVMHANPRTVHANALAVEAVELMEANRITSVLVVDARGCLIGALNSNDLMRAKVI
jgi:arabinose-5-phosphate isomerase